MTILENCLEQFEGIHGGAELLEKLGHKHPEIQAAIQESKNFGKAVKMAAHDRVKAVFVLKHSISFYKKCREEGHSVQNSISGAFAGSTVMVALETTGTVMMADSVIVMYSSGAQAATGVGLVTAVGTFCLGAAGFQAGMYVQQSSHTVGESVALTHAKIKNDGGYIKSFGRLIGVVKKEASYQRFETPLSYVKDDIRVINQFDSAKDLENEAKVQLPKISDLTFKKLEDCSPEEQVNLQQNYTYCSLQTPLLCNSDQTSDDSGYRYFMSLLQQPNAMPGELCCMSPNDSYVGEEHKLIQPNDSVSNGMFCPMPDQPNDHQPVDLNCACVSPLLLCGDTDTLDQEKFDVNFYCPEFCEEELKFSTVPVSVERKNTYETNGERYVNYEACFKNASSQEAKVCVNCACSTDEALSIVGSCIVGSKRQSTMTPIIVADINADKNQTGDAICQFICDNVTGVTKETFNEGVCHILNDIQENGVAHSLNRLKDEKAFGETKQLFRVPMKSDYTGFLTAQSQMCNIFENINTGREVNIALNAGVGNDNQPSYSHAATSANIYNFFNNESYQVYKDWASHVDTTHKIAFDRAERVTVDHSDLSVFYKTPLVPSNQIAHFPSEYGGMEKPIQSIDLHGKLNQSMQLTHTGMPRVGMSGSSGRGFAVHVDFGPLIAFVFNAAATAFCNIL